MDERRGEAFELDEQLTVIGPRLRVGEEAPGFVLEGVDPVEGSVAPIRLSDSAGVMRVLNVINSVDTSVCDIETRRWEQMSSDLPAGTRLLTISMDLPFAMARWQKEAGVGHQMVSAHKDERFATDYGVLIQEWRLLQRSVFVIDGDGRLIHVEYVADQMREPDYEAAIAAARG
jgi:thiol peroxidase